MPETYFKKLVSKIAAHYPEREAHQIARILLEDLFQLVPPFDEGLSLDDQEEKILAKALLQLQVGKPVQYITEVAYFYGYPFKVSPAVLIPRPETEELVHFALELLAVYPEKNPHILDVGTGSGCIPISIKKQRQSAELVAIDKSPEALLVAQQNAANLGATIDWHQLDFTDKDSWTVLGDFDFVLSNPPYIPQAERHLVGENVLGQEPDMALFVPDDDPHLFYRLLAEFGGQHLRAKGHLLVETNQYNAQEVASLFREFGYNGVEVLSDLMGNDRMVRAIKAN